MSEHKFQVPEKEGDWLSAFAAVLDLEGFTPFAASSDSHTLLPRFIGQFYNLIEHSLSRSFSPQQQVTGKRLQRSGSTCRPQRPTFTKFLGDGVLFIWVYDPLRPSAKQQLLEQLPWSLDLLQWQLNLFLDQFRAENAAGKAPKSARVGLAAGFIYPVKATKTSVPWLEYENVDYVGHCINVASRLSAIRGLGHRLLLEDNAAPKSPRMKTLMLRKVKGLGPMKVKVFKKPLHKRFLAKAQ